MENNHVAVTIYDVARRAGVGVGTVSRVLNDSPQVRKETRDRVMAVIEQLNYRPSPIAQRLSLRKTLSIGVIAPFFTEPSVVERLRGIERVLADSEYDMIVYNVEVPARRDFYFDTLPTSLRVDGIIIISLFPTDDNAIQWADAGLPIILVDTNHPGFSRIIIDDVAGGVMAVQHLIDLGHRKIALAADKQDAAFRFTATRDRYQGYREALADNGIPFRPDYHRSAAHGRAEARVLTHQLLGLADPPTAIFATSDTQAFGVIQAAQDLGVRIPQDLSVVGYDDLELAEYLSLTTVRQPLLESGKRGAEMVLSAIADGRGEVMCDLLPLELVVRSSTAPRGSQR